MDPRFGPDLLAAGPRSIVAVVLTCQGRLAVFKRSRRVTGDAGLWHCITGFLDDGNNPKRQALIELEEETGLRVGELRRLHAHGTLELADGLGALWRVHMFKAETRQTRLVLNWEHEAYRWVPQEDVSRLDGQVAWLGDVIRATDAERSASLDDGSAGGGERAHGSADQYRD